MKHYIITRYNLNLYNRPDAEEWMIHRWGLFQWTRDSILDQKGDWEWIILIDHRTPDQWRQKLQGDRIRIIEGDVWKAMAFIRPSSEWVITTRIDNDDYYLSDDVFLQIQSKAEEREMVVDIDYYQEYKGEFYTSERIAPNSPFVSLVEYSSLAKGVYHCQHTKIHIERHWVKLGVLAVMVIHDQNLANKIIGNKI